MRAHESISRALDVAQETARRAGKLLRSRLGRVREIRYKPGQGNLVTEMDHASEALILRALRRAFPDHGIVAEEQAPIRAGSRAVWYVDPLDGTANYAHGLPIYCVSIGLEVGGEPAVGVVYNPELDEMFTAVRGGGARRNGRRIRVSTLTDLADGFLVTGFPYDRALRLENLHHFNAFMRSTRTIRRIGAAALDLCYVASGIFDGFWEFALSPWDLAAGRVIVIEAGGRVTDFSGGTRNLRGQEVLATNGLLHAAMQRVIRRVRRNRREVP